MALLSLSSGVGTQRDVMLRLKSVLPAGWFGDSTPTLDGVLTALGAGWAKMFDLLAYVQNQTRVATASDIFLDLVAADFFGGALSRSAGEPDDSLRSRIKRELLRERATRPALIAALKDLTGRPPRIFEPARIVDTGAYGVSTSLSYNRAGGWGTFALPFQCFVRAYRPVGIGVARCGGYGTGGGGYRVGAIQYATPNLAASTVRDADIYASAAAMAPVATTLWVAISD